MSDTNEPNDDETIDVELVAGEAVSDDEPAGPITAFNEEPAGPITAFNAEPKGSSASAEEPEESFYEAEDGAGSPDGGE